MPYRTYEVPYPLLTFSSWSLSFILRFVLKRLSLGSGKCRSPFVTDSLWLLFSSNPSVPLKNLKVRPQSLPSHEVNTDRKLPGPSAF